MVPSQKLVLAPGAIIRGNTGMVCFTFSGTDDYKLEMKSSWSTGNL